MSRLDVCYTKNPTRTLVQLVKNKPRNQSISRKKGRRFNNSPKTQNTDSPRPRGIFARKNFTRTFQNVFQIYCGPHPSLFFLQLQNRATSALDSSARRNIMPHYRPRPNPGPRSNPNTRQQRHIDTRPNIITKNRPQFPPTSINPPTLHHRHNRGIIEPEISSNRPRTQRASSTNDTIPNVGQMRHLRPVHQCTILHITISPNLRPFPHHSVRSKIRVRTHNRILSNEHWTLQITTRTDRTSPRKMKHSMNMHPRFYHPIPCRLHDIQRQPIRT